MNLFDTARLSRRPINAKITEFASFCLTGEDRVEVVDYFVHSTTGAASVMSRREMSRTDARRVYREFQAKGYAVAITSRFAQDVAASRSYSNGVFDLAQQVAQQLTDSDRAAGREAPAYGYSSENFRRAEDMISAECHR